MDVEAAIVGAGVVGSAAALALARRRVSVSVLEAEPEPGIAASGTNSGILHTGFDSIPGELETELILRSAQLRDPVSKTLGVPFVRCGALMQPREGREREAVASLARNAAINGVQARLRDSALEVPGESITDPVAYTLALADSAQRHGAELRVRFRVASIEGGGDGFTLQASSGESLTCRVVVNCAGLFADEVARAAGDESFDIYPRRGEFMVFDPPGGEQLNRILLPVPSKRTKGVLVFPTIDGKLVAGPTAVDGDDKHDWTVRPEAREEILAKAVAIHPPLEGADPIAAYAGLRPAGREVNYLIGHSGSTPGLVNVAAIRSTGLTASLGIAERVCALVSELGIELGPEQPLLPPASATRPGSPWWTRTATFRGLPAEGG